MYYAVCCHIDFLADYNEESSDVSFEDLRSGIFFAVCYRCNVCEDQRPQQILVNKFGRMHIPNS